MLLVGVVAGRVKTVLLMEPVVVLWYPLMLGGVPSSCIEAQAATCVVYRNRVHGGGGGAHQGCLGSMWQLGAPYAVCSYHVSLVA